MPVMPLDDVVEGFQVLHVDGRIDVDAGGQQFLDVLPALGMARSFDIAVRQLVDQDERGAARERRVQVELLQRAAAHGGAAQRQALEAGGHGLGLAAPMGLDHAHDDVEAAVAQAPRRREHGVGLAHAGRGAEEDLQATPQGPRGILAYAGDQGIRIRAALASAVPAGFLGQPAHGADLTSTATRAGASACSARSRSGGASRASSLTRAKKRGRSPPSPASSASKAGTSSW